jgi:hypothetical protein
MTLPRQAAHINKIAKSFAKIPWASENSALYANCPLDKHINLTEKLNVLFDLLQTVSEFDKGSILSNVDSIKKAKQHFKYRKRALRQLLLGIACKNSKEMCINLDKCDYADQEMSGHIYRRMF